MARWACDSYRLGMSDPLSRSIKSVVVTSSAPEITAAFYRDVVGLPLEEEGHRGTERHFAGQVGAQHFAVHPNPSFWLRPLLADAAATIVSFDVEDIAGAEARLAQHGVPVLARAKIGPMSFLAVRDPDGRVVCFGTRWPDRRGPSDSPRAR